MILSIPFFYSGPFCLLASGPADLSGNCLLGCSGPKTKCHLLAMFGIASLLRRFLHSSIWKASYVPGTVLDHGDTAVAKEPLFSWNLIWSGDLLHTLKVYEAWARHSARCLT